MLTGTPLIQGSECVVLCGGVGYGVAVNERTLEHIAAQKEVTLYIHTHVREDELKLYGFLTLQERHLFDLFVSSVQGVGPRTALAIMNSPVAEISTAVEEGDVAFFTEFPRVGKKLAQKIILELRSKLSDAKGLELEFSGSKQKDLREALHSLGYSDKEILHAIRGLDTTTLTLETAIKESLKAMNTR